MTKFIPSDICQNCDICNKNLPLFDGLTEEILEILNTNRAEVKFKKGENIIKQGMPANHLVVITSGLAKTYIEGVNDKRLILEIIPEWDFLGSQGMFTDGRYHYSASAIVDTTTCFIDQNNIREVFRRDSRFAENFIRGCSTKSIQTFERFISLTQKQMHGRIADALIYLSEDIFESEIFEMTISKQDLGELTSLTKDSSVRILKELTTDGIIEFNGSKMKINDIEKLRQISLRG